MKRLMLLLIVALSLSSVFGLTAGDIAIIGVNTDATKSIAFVALADIPANTTISFSDNAWNATTQVWRTGEGLFTWSHTSVVAKGTVVTVSMPTTFTATIGTVTKSGSFDLAAAGDQVLAYEGTTAPTSNSSSLWLYGFSTESFVWGNNTNTSDLPTALSSAFIALTSSTTEFDNAYFANGSTAQTAVSVSGTKTELLAFFNDNTKYYKNDTGPLTFPTYTITVGSGAAATITVTGTMNAFSTISGTASAYQSYKVSGANLTADISVTAPASFELCKTSGGTYTSGLTFAQSGGTVAEQDVFVRIAASAGAGTPSGNITHTSSGATQIDKSVNGIVYKTEPTNHVTNFIVSTGTPSYSVIDAIWEDATGIVVPDGYLIKGSSIGYSSIIDPVDGAAEANASLVQNVAAGVESASFTGLSEHTTYYFKIYPYTNSGTNIAYKTNDTVPTGDYTTTYGPPVAPTADSATAVSHEGFTAHFDAVPGATSYRIDVMNGTAQAVATDLFFSEYIEGSSNNKAIEIFNGTGATVDLSDYRFENWFNGLSTPSTYTFSGTLANGDTFVLAHPSANATILALADATTSNASFNGDDALVLRKISTDTIVDIFGVMGQDPGTEWTATGGYTTVDRTLVRKSTVTGGITTNPSISNPVVTTDFLTLGTEWDMYAMDTTTYLGSHTMGSTVTFVTGWNNKAVNNTVVRVYGLDPDSDYSYRVRAVNDYGTSSNSNVVEVTTGAETEGAGANTSISGASTVVLVEPLTGFTNNNVEIDPDTSTSDDISISVAATEIAIQYSITANDAALSGLFWLNHAGLGFTPVNCRVNAGTIVEWSSTANETFVEISDFGAKGTLIITLEDEQTTPVELSSFSAVLNAQNNVNILWVTQTETSLTGYYVLRGTSEDFVSAELISPMIEPTNSSQQQHYVYTDDSVTEPGTYYYWLQVAEMDGNNILHGPTTVNFTSPDGPGTPGVDLITGLHSVYPNPFNPNTTIGYGIAKAAEVNFSIFNARGQVVRTISQGMKQPNNYKLTWNGKDNNGVECSTGIYFIRMEAGKDSFTRKAMLMK